VVPVVEPPDGTVIVTGLFVVELNVAVTAVAAVTVTTHAPIPVQAPPQPAKTEPSAALCVNVTCVPLAKLAEQVSGQIIPAGALVTVPVPFPASVTVNVKLLTLAVKFAVTAVAAPIVNVHVPVPSQGPAPQPVNVDPVAGAAVNVTIVPLAKLAAHAVPQLIPAGALVTVPVPVPAFVTVTAKVFAAVNVAVTAAAAVTVTTQAPVPVHAPLHPAKVDPVAATCVNVTIVPLAKLAAHAVPQLIPVGALVTVPVPVPAFVTVNANVFAAVNVAVTAAAAVTIRTQAPVPVHAPLHPANVDPVAGAAVNVTIVPLAKLAAHAVPQLIPVGALVTVPVPVPASATVNVKFVAAPTVALIVAVLFAIFGSGKSETTLAELVTVPVAFAAIVTTIVSVACAAFATDPRLHVSVVVPVHAEPCDGVAETSVVIAGSTSVTITFVVSFGPKFAAVSVYVRFEPGATVLADCVIVSDTSADCTVPFRTANVVRPGIVPPIAC